MASLASFIRSAAQATFSAYRTVPVRWRLGGGSAALTFVILTAFAGVVDVLTDRQVVQGFNEHVRQNTATLQAQMLPRYDPATKTLECTRQMDLATFAAVDNGEIRVFDNAGKLLCTQNSPETQQRMNATKPSFPTYIFDLPQGYVYHGYYTQVAPLKWNGGSGWLMYAQPLAQIDNTVAKVRVALVLGVLGGSFLALLAGLYVARRAMRPIQQLTEAAAEIERTRDTSLRIPHPEAEDEVAELARTLEGMLGSLDSARTRARPRSRVSASLWPTPHTSCARR